MDSRLPESEFKQAALSAWEASDPPDVPAHSGVTPLPRRLRRRIATPRHIGVVRRGGDRQHPADRLAPLGIGRAPSGRHARALQASTDWTFSSRLHPLKSWSLRGTRGGSLVDAAKAWGACQINGLAAIIRIYPSSW